MVGPLWGRGQVSTVALFRCVSGCNIYQDQAPDGALGTHGSSCGMWQGGPLSLRSVILGRGQGARSIPQHYGE